MKKMRISLLVLAVLTVCPLLAEEMVLPQEKSLLPENTLRAFKLTNSLAKNVHLTRVSVEDQPFKEALQLEVMKKGDGPMYMAQLQANTIAPVDLGDVILVSFRMRTLKATNEETQGITTVCFQTSGKKKFQKLILREAVAGPEWKSFCFYGRARDEHTTPVGESNLNFWLNTDYQVIELADIRLYNLGRDVDTSKLPVDKATYAGREPDAQWRAEAAERIEKYRKGDLVVKVTDANGQPVENAGVNVNMNRHAFLWGTAPGRFFFLGRDNLVGLSGEEREHARKFMLNWFNQISPEWQLKERMAMPGVVGWTDPNAPMVQRTIESLKWARENNLSIYGHWLVCAAYPASKNPYYESLHNDKDAFKQAFYNLVRTKVKMTKGLVDSWDITHPVSIWSKEPRLAEYLGLGDKMYSDLIRIVHKEVPGLPVYVNEGSILPGGKTGSYHRKAYAEFIHTLIKQGTPVDGISFMGHFTDGTLTSPEDLYAVIDQYATEFKLPIRITEMDVDAGEDEQLQADYLRDVIITAFSHPAVECITQWGFWEKNHWKPNRATVRKDWTLKPAGKVYEDLVFNQFWTETKGQTGADGKFKTRGFLGDYEITAEHSGVSMTIKAVIKRGKNEVEIKLDK